MILYSFLCGALKATHSSGWPSATTTEGATTEAVGLPVGMADGALVGLADASPKDREALRPRRSQSLSDRRVSRI